MSKIRMNLPPARPQPTLAGGALQGLLAAVALERDELQVVVPEVSVKTEDLVEVAGSEKEEKVCSAKLKATFSKVQFSQGGKVVVSGAINVYGTRSKFSELIPKTNPKNRRTFFAFLKKTLSASALDEVERSLTSTSTEPYTAKFAVVNGVLYFSEVHLICSTSDVAKSQAHPKVLQKNKEVSVQLESLIRNYSLEPKDAAILRDHFSQKKSWLIKADDVAANFSEDSNIMALVNTVEKAWKELDSKLKASASQSAIEESSLRNKRPKTEEEEKEEVLPEMSKYKKPGLQMFLKQRGEKTSGNKQELLARCRALVSAPISAPTAALQFPQMLSETPLVDGILADNPGKSSILKKRKLPQLSEPEQAEELQEVQPEAQVQAT
mmetsp:Transcript_9549/g.13908  ORF Transcript_9549/g.13908 Transcript_9549/m.13908 type:complete len:381 (-) Transcript_9549:350-1492(-)